MIMNGGSLPYPELIETKNTDFTGILRAKSVFCYIFESFAWLIRYI